MTAENPPNQSKEHETSRFRHRASPLYTAALSYHARLCAVGERLMAEDRRQLVNAARTLVVRIAAALEVGERQDAPPALESAIRAAARCSASLDCCASLAAVRTAYAELREQIDAIGDELISRREVALQELRGRGPVQEEASSAEDHERTSKTTASSGSEEDRSSGCGAPPPKSTRALLAAGITRLRGSPAKGPHEGARRPERHPG